MRSEPKAVLITMYASKGDRIVRDPELCNALLIDGCGECKREIAILVNTVRCGAAQELLGSTAPYTSLRARLIQKVQDEQGLTPEAASWGVDTWREALTGGGAGGGPGGGPKKNGWRSWFSDASEADPLPNPDDIVRDWRSGQQTKNTRRAMSYVRGCASGGEKPNLLREELRKRGIANDVAEQLMVKCAPFAGLGKFGYGAVLLFFWALASAMGTGEHREVFTVMFLLGVASLIWGVVARWKWRQWIKSIALRNTRAA